MQLMRKIGKHCKSLFIHKNSKLQYTPTNQGVGRSNRSGRTTSRKGLFLKGSKPFLFQAENINLGTPKRKLVNRGNLQIPASQSYTSKQSAKYNELPEFRSRKSLIELSEPQRQVMQGFA
jgi:hypothetical protein